MAAPVARNLIRLGHEVLLLDLNKEAVARVLAVSDALLPGHDVEVFKRFRVAMKNNDTFRKQDL